MDRSLVPMERSRSGVNAGSGSTMKKQTTQPHNGTVVDLLLRRSTRMDASGHGARQHKALAVPMRLVCTRRTMPAADVTRNRPSQRPFVNHATNTHAPRSS